jgi:hemolysin D
MTWRHRAEAYGDLWRRYRGMFRHSWATRHHLSMPTLEPHEAEFLPAALAILAKPVSPAGRWVARILMMFIAALVTWAIVGRIDIIVNAEGKLIPSGYSKTIASVDIASVRALHVEEGQAVKAGDLLVELDSRETDSLHDKATSDRWSATLQALRARSLLTALDRGTLAPLHGGADVPPDQVSAADSHVQDQWRDYLAKRARLESDFDRYTEELPLATQRAQDFAGLARTGDVAQHDWIEAEQARIELARQLDSAREQLIALTAETRKTAQDELAEAERTRADSVQDERRAGAHSELLRLTAPVDGTVQQLTVHTVGGVVPAAQPLMQIVPNQHDLEMEAFLENKDVGFVQDGQKAEVKIDAFEYTKYGTIAGRVSHVSRDAIQDDKRGLIYSVRVTIDSATIAVDGRRATLEPGMSGSVEILTGDRRIIEYVLSPLIKHRRESFHER